MTKTTLLALAGLALTVPASAHGFDKDRLNSTREGRGNLHGEQGSDVHFRKATVVLESDKDIKIHLTGEKTYDFTGHYRREGNGVIKFKVTTGPWPRIKGTGTLNLDNDHDSFTGLSFNATSGNGNKSFDVNFDCSAWVGRRRRGG